MRKSQSHGVAIVVFLVSASSQAATGQSWSKSGGWGGSESFSGSSSSTLRNPSASNRDTFPFAPGSHNIALDLGQVFLMGDLAGQYSDSIGTQVHYNYGVSDTFAFDASLGFSEHSEGRYSMATLLTGMRVNFSWYDKVIPYGVGGLGFYRPNYKDTPVTTPSNQPAYLSALLFGVHLGGGVDLELSRNFFFGASLTFHNMFGASKTSATGTTISLGGAYTSFLLHTGVSF